MNYQSPRLLLVDDDVELAEMLGEFLRVQGFDVDLCHEGATALDSLGDSPPDLMVLDVMLPDIDGFQVLKSLRARRDIPVIMMTARGEESERIRGLLGGADDYMPKPCNPIELTARVRSVLRRASAARGHPVAASLQVGPLRMDTARRELTANRRRVAVTAAEFRVMQYLMQRPGEVVARSELIEYAMNRPLEAYDRTIDTLISRLRRKLGETGMDRGCLRAVRGHGYVLDERVFRSRRR